MTPKKVEKKGTNLPLLAMFWTALFSAVIVCFSFEVIKVWPLPQSVDPYFGGFTGAAWGLVVGAIAGLVLGYLTDDSHFESNG